MVVSRRWPLLRLEAHAVLNVYLELRERFPDTKISDL